MVQKAKPKVAIPMRPPRPGLGGTGVPQEAFEEAGTLLAAKLGWETDGTTETDELVYQDITVRDARQYCIKTLHEHHQAGAKGAAQPQIRIFSRHLAVDTPEERELVTTVLRAAYEGGIGKEYVAARVVRHETTAELEGTAAGLLEKAFDGGLAVPDTMRPKEQE